jgi:hypothetical protein
VDDLEFDRLVSRLRGHALVDQATVEQIMNRLDAGDIDRTQARKWLRALDEGEPLSPQDISPQQVATEWVALLDGMAAEAMTWQGIAGAQFRQAFYLLPAAAVITLIIAILASSQWDVPTQVLSPLAGACLATLAAQSFFVFRVHQQARLAAERLSEKRAAVLFLRLALGRTDPEERAQILAAGTAMFLGHQTAATVPLTAEDRKTT